MFDALDTCFEISKLLKYSLQRDALFQKLKSDLSLRNYWMQGFMPPQDGPFELMSIKNC